MSTTCACCTCRGRKHEPFTSCFIEHRHGCDGDHSKRDYCNRGAAVAAPAPALVEDVERLTAERDEAVKYLLNGPDDLDVISVELERDAALNTASALLDENKRIDAANAELRRDLAEARTLLEAESTHRDGDRCRVCEHMGALNVESVYDENARHEQTIAAVRKLVDQLESENGLPRHYLGDPEYDTREDERRRRMVVAGLLRKALYVRATP